MNTPHLSVFSCYVCGPASNIRDEETHRTILVAARDQSQVDRAVLAAGFKIVKRGKEIPLIYHEGTIPCVLTML